MATSGSVKTSSYEGRYYQVSWTASQSVANNQSTISWTLKALGGSASWYAERTLNVVVAGKTVYTKTDRVQRYTGTIASGTVTVNHNSNGDASFSISIQAAVYVTTVNCTGSSSFTLTNIPRKSTLSVGNGTLGTAQTLTVTRKSNSFTHTITATCGSSMKTICTKSSATSISFTPPLEWASQNTTGTTVSVVYAITTYNGNTSVGSNSYTKSCTIPSSVKPSCTVAVTDAMGYATKYGGYIKGLSKFKVVVTPTMSYNSPIASYSTTANGATYTASNFTTGVLKSSGTLTVKATVKDKRGRSGNASASLNVLNYTAPAINKLAVVRCNEDGAENDKGEFVRVTFSCSITSLDGKNSAKYKLEYKSSSDSGNPTEVQLSDFEGLYSVNDGVYIFAADSGSSYEIKVTAVDDFHSIMRTTSVSTAFTLMHWHKSGFGMAIGKIAELAGVFDIGLQIRFFGGILQPVLERGTNFDDVIIPNTYTLKNCNSANYTNCPVSSGTGSLKVESIGEEGQLRQVVTVCSKANPLRYERHYYGGSWGEWICTSDFDGVLLWSGGVYMTAAQRADLTEPISKQRNGIILVFSRYSSSTVRDYHFNHFFVHKQFVATKPGLGSTFLMTTDGSFSVMASKYLYIHDEYIAGNDANTSTGTGTSGVKYENNGFVLRYVIGV